MTAVYCEVKSRTQTRNTFVDEILTTSVCLNREMNHQLSSYNAYQIKDDFSLWTTVVDNYGCATTSKVDSSKKNRIAVPLDN